MSMAIRWPMPVLYFVPQVPPRSESGAEIAGAHFGAQLEAAAREDRGAGTQIVLTEVVTDADSFHTRVAGEQGGGGRVVDHRDVELLQACVQGCYEVLTAAEDMAGQTAPELEFAIDLEGLAPEGGLEAHAVAAKPDAGLEAVADQDLGEVGIATVFGEATHVVEILRFGVAAEIDG